MSILTEKDENPFEVDFVVDDNDITLAASKFLLVDSDQDDEHDDTDILSL